MVMCKYQGQMVISFPWKNMENQFFHTEDCTIVWLLKRWGLLLLVDRKKSHFLFFFFYFNKSTHGDTYIFLTGKIEKKRVKTDIKLVSLSSPNNGS